MTGKLLLKLDTVKYIISHHNVKILLNFDIVFSTYILDITICLNLNYQMIVQNNVNSFSYLEGTFLFSRRAYMFQKHKNLLLHGG